jgi:hypothetical protein
MEGPHNILPQYTAAAHCDTPIADPTLDGGFYVNPVFYPRERIICSPPNIRCHSMRFSRIRASYAALRWFSFFVGRLAFK